MSSDLRAEPKLSRRSLRTRLIAEQLALLALVCLVISVLTVVVLRAFLVGQLDAQLDAASDRTVRWWSLPTRVTRSPVDAPGQSVGTISALIRGGRVIEAGRVAPETGEREPLSGRQRAVLAAEPPDGGARTRDLDELGRYRLTARHAGVGYVIVTGLPLGSVDDTEVRVSVVLGAVSLLGLVTTGIAGVVIIRRTLRPLNRVAATAGRVAELPLDKGEVALPVRVPHADTDPGTEVGRVGAALNRMLGHIGEALSARHASETRVRQFVADASHELRTPLAAIRGYAELAQRHPELPPEVEHAIGRVDSESRRMTVLVEDLLLLARLDSGRPLEREPVDLSRLVLDAVGDARVSGPDHLWRLELPPEPVYAVGDQVRLHQVLANLLANGCRHTPAGTTVTTGLSPQGGAVVLTVTDDGPGISPEMRPKVFERFVRGDGSRSRAAGSTGLGLSIVAAVVSAHHGTVGLTSRSGETRFTVKLPAANIPG
ncbi:sensor histidine kinase [Actinomadura rugatobispora]|uniref:histidine kinase n=1 Tax=Actinomadura rugatobispora TaxID=1994 RepID=A0ABW1A7T3_9ACTN|nr:HAMP domain-containing sensor histidine kinase [Actinomadura rugatobispora]